MGPSRHMDSWAMWFYHKTWLGAKWTKAFRAMVHGLWVRSVPLSRGSRVFVPIAAYRQISIGFLHPSSLLSKHS